MENQNLDLDTDCLSFATVAKVQGRDWPFHPDQDHLYMYILFHIHPDQDRFYVYSFIFFFILTKIMFIGQDNDR